MRIYCYARCKTEADAEAAGEALRKWAELWHLPTGYYPQFDHDLLSGQRGLSHTLRRLEQNDILAIRNLSDLGRDLRELLKNATDLRKRGVHVRSMAKGIDLDVDTGFRVMEELFEAHKHYGRANVRLGVKTAKIGGAKVGRPPRPELAPKAVFQTFGELRNTNGKLPSVRKAATALGCSPTKAFRLLQAYKKFAEALQK